MSEIVAKIEAAQALLSEEIHQLVGGDLEHFMANHVLKALHSSWGLLAEEVRSGEFDEESISPDMLIDKYQACIGLLNTLLPNVIAAAESVNSNDAFPDAGRSAKI